MVNLPPDSNEQRSRDRDLNFDEIVALIVVFLSLGAVLWWGLTRGRVLPDIGANLERPIFSLDESASDTDEPLPLMEDEAVDTDPQSPASATRPSLRERLARRQARSPALRPAPVPIPTPEPVPALEEPVGDALIEEPSAVVPSPSPVQPIEPEPTAPPPLDISDVPETYWAYPYIKNLYDNGLLPDFPEGQFRPDQELTRAEFAALLESSLIENGSANPANFVDVPETYWAKSAIDQVVASGFMSGYPEGNFRPDQFVPRYEVLVTLVAGLGLAPSQNPEAQLGAFTDDLSQMPEWAIARVATAAENDFLATQPNPNVLRPTDTATRAEIVAMIHQALVLQGRLVPPETP